MALGLSQEELGQRLGLTFQQVQKYELGRNRVSASRLYQLSEELGVPISWFFEGIERPERDVSPAPGQNGFPHTESRRPEQRELLELVRVYHQIGTPGLRKQLHAIARILADSEGQPDLQAAAHD